MPIVSQPNHLFATDRQFLEPSSPKIPTAANALKRPGGRQLAKPAFRHKPSNFAAYLLGVGCPWLVDSLP